MFNSITVERWSFGQVVSKVTVKATLEQKELIGKFLNVPSEEIPVNPDERIVIILEPSHDNVPGPMR